MRYLLDWSDRAAGPKANTSHVQRLLYELVTLGAVVTVFPDYGEVSTTHFPENHVYCHRCGAYLQFGHHPSCTAQTFVRRDSLEK